MMPELEKSRPAAGAAEPGREPLGDGSRDERHRAVERPCPRIVARVRPAPAVDAPRPGLDTPTSNSGMAAPSLARGEAVAAHGGHHGGDARRGGAWSSGSSRRSPRGDQEPARGGGHARRPWSSAVSGAARRRRSRRPRPQTASVHRRARHLGGLAAGGDAQAPDRKANGNGRLAIVATPRVLRGLGRRRSARDDAAGGVRAPRRAASHRVRAAVAARPRP